MDEQRLPGITCPADLRGLSREELPGLAAEIRETLVRTVARNGGHLASNLGVVELTIALHLCFESPKDALVWDVSHQSYTHKLLSGRQEKFATLRQSGGLSGFTSAQESAHDHFTAGHASTSVSAALGLAEAKLLQGDPHFSVAILGDGAMTGGLAYEALNNAGHSSAHLIVVLNDNEMSISRNVGGLSRYLALVRARPQYRRTKRWVERGLRRIPWIGGGMARIVAKIKRIVKRILTDTTLFEQMGLDYIGPVDGHNIERLCAAFESAKLTQRPALVHVHTVKGKGLCCAEEAPERFHGVGQFDPESGEATVSKGSFTDVFGEELCAIASQNPAVCAVTAAMAIGTGLAQFAEKFPERCYDVGIAEGHALTFAAGLARQGMRPVAALYSTFLQRGFDQLLHDAALQRLPLVVAVDRAGFVGSDGATHHGLYDLAFCAAIPGAQVYAPATAEELRQCLRAGLGGEGLTLIRYPRGKAESLPELPLLRGGEGFELYGDPAADCAIVTYGRLFFEACKVPGVRILKLRRVLPIAAEAAEALLDCQRICFFEEGIRTGGAGERFGLMLLERRFMGEFDLHAVEGFARHAPVEELLAEHELDAAAMRRAAEGGHAA